MKLLFALLVAATPVLAQPVAPPNPAPIPKSVVDMLRIAVDSGDQALAASMVRLAKTSNPTARAEIDALHARLLAGAERRRLARLRRLRLYQGWKGKGEFGAVDTTGRTNSTGVTARLSLVREGLRWRQEFTASLDYLHHNGIEERDRYFVGHQANYKFSDRLYALGLASWEGNRAQGFNSRTTTSVGAGVTLVKGPRMGVSMEVSPAVRATSYLGAGNDTSLAARVAGNAHWNVTPRLTISEEATYYRETNDRSLTSESALTLKLIGALSTRFSYRMQRESKSLPLPVQHSDDSTSRLSLVYTF